VEKSYLFTAKLILGPRFIVLAMCSFYKNTVADRSEMLCSRAG